MKPYGVFSIPDDARKALDDLAKENNWSAPLNDGSVLVIGRTDDGEDLAKFPDLQTAENAAELANMAFEWGRRYQAARPDEPWESEYKEVELFSKEATDSAAGVVFEKNE